MRSFRPIRVFRIGAFALAACFAVHASLTTGQQKVNMIERDRWPSHGPIAFTPRELLALGMSQIDSAAPGAVLNPTLRLEPGGATATALIDFDQLKGMGNTGQADGNWLFSRLISGRQPVTVSVAITSARGKMTVHPTAVSVSGYSVSGGALNFIVQNFLVAQYPNAVIDKPFALPSNIGRVELSAKSALVYRQVNKTGRNPGSPPLSFAAAELHRRWAAIACAAFFASLTQSGTPTPSYAFPIKAKLCISPLSRAILAKRSPWPTTY
jgi:hypothetical protein